MQSGALYNADQMLIPAILLFMESGNRATVLLQKTGPRVLL